MGMRWNPMGLEEVELEWICASDMLAIENVRYCLHDVDMGLTGGEASDRGIGCGAMGREGAAAVSAQNQPILIWQDNCSVNDV
jgi:hypothetical protein